MHNRARIPTRPSVYPQPLTLSHHNAALLLYAALALGLLATASFTLLRLLTRLAPFADSPRIQGHAP